MSLYTHIPNLVIKKTLSIISLLRLIILEKMYYFANILLKNIFISLKKNIKRENS